MIVLEKAIIVIGVMVVINSVGIILLSIGNIRSSKQRSKDAN